MRIDERIASGAEPAFSFEFFPPKTDEGEANLADALTELARLEPTFVSVTYGAGGTPAQRGKTIDIVCTIKADHGLEAMAHFTCVGASVDELRAVLDRMRDAGIENVLALRGDPPAGVDASEWVAADGGLRYSRELIELIRADYDFAVGAACFPEVHLAAESAESDLKYTREKVDAGAKFLITQLFFDNQLYYDFVARARDAGIDVPIIPGIMPITNAAQIRRFTQMCGASIPPGLLRELELRARPARRGHGLRRRLRDDAVRRPARQRRARHPLLHAQPLALDARDPQRAALHGALAPRGHGVARRPPGRRESRGRRPRSAPSRRRRLGDTATPTDRPTGGSAVTSSTGSAASTSSTIAAAVARPSSSLPRTHTPNSSPPRRPATPWRARTRATSARTRSPERWPWASLTLLKASMSQISSVPGCARDQLAADGVDPAAAVVQAGQVVGVGDGLEPPDGLAEVAGGAGRGDAGALGHLVEQLGPRVELLQREPSSVRSISLPASRWATESASWTQAASRVGQARPVAPPW